MPGTRRNQIVFAAGLASLVFLFWLWSSVPLLVRVPVSKRPATGEPAVLEANWPQLRGPTFDSISVETGLADSWPEEGPPVVWTRELGQGYSSFAAVGDRVFTQVQSLYQQSVVCLYAESGDAVWSYNYGWPYEGGGLYPGPRSTPTWHDGRLYFASPDGMIGCLDADKGHLLWSSNPKKAHRGRGTDFGYACSPVIVEGKVIVPVGGLNASVVALDARDGSIVWSSGDSSASYATPLPILRHGRPVVVTPLENSIAAFDVGTGKRLWEIEFSEGYDEHSAAPLYREPYLCVASPFRAGAKCYRLVDERPPADKQENGSDDGDPSNANKSSAADPARDELPVVKWESPKFSNDIASSVLVDGRLYGFDLKDPQSRLDRPSRGEFRCLDFETGRVIWSTIKVGQANLIVADEKLILFTDSGELILVRTGTDEYIELARTQVFRDEICWTSAALHRGCIYLRTQTRAACVYLGETPYQARLPVRLVKDIPRGRAFDAKWLIGGEREFPATVPEWHEFRLWYKWSLGGLLLASLVSSLFLAGVHCCRWTAQRCFAQRIVFSSEARAFAENGIGQIECDSPDISSNRLNHDRRVSVSVARTFYWLTVTTAGVIGSPLINCRQSEYVLIWPLSLWAIFQMTINVITWTERHPERQRARWLSRGCGLLFVGTCLLYFSLCRGLGYAIEWSFLVGFLPGFAVAAWAARFLTTRRKFWPVTDLAFSMLSFTAYFWLSVIFIKWKLVVGS